MPKKDYSKKPQAKEGLSYQDILQRAAKRGDTIAQNELKWRERKYKHLNSPTKTYRVGFKKSFI